MNISNLLTTNIPHGVSSDLRFILNNDENNYSYTNSILDSINTHFTIESQNSNIQNVLSNRHDIQYLLNSNSFEQENISNSVNESSNKNQTPNKEETGHKPESVKHGSNEFIHNITEDDIINAVVLSYNQQKLDPDSVKNQYQSHRNGPNSLFHTKNLGKNQALAKKTNLENCKIVWDDSIPVLLSCDDDNTNNDEINDLDEQSTSKDKLTSLKDYIGKSDKILDYYIPGYLKSIEIRDYIYAEIASDIDFEKHAKLIPIDPSPNDQDLPQILISISKNNLLLLFNENELKNIKKAAVPTLLTNRKNNTQEYQLKTSESNKKNEACELYWINSETIINHYIGASEKIIKKCENLQEDQIMCMMEILKSHCHKNCVDLLLRCDQKYKTGIPIDPNVLQSEVEFVKELKGLSPKKKRGRPLKRKYNGNINSSSIDDDDEIDALFDFEFSLDNYYGPDNGKIQIPLDQKDLDVLSGLVNWIHFNLEIMNDKFQKLQNSIMDCQEEYVEFVSRVLKLRNKL